MSKFIKLVTTARNGEGGDTLYFNLDNIVAIHKERGLIYGSNGAGQDVFCIDKDSMEELIHRIESRDNSVENLNTI